jgi:integrase
MKLAEGIVSRIAVPAGKREALVFDDALPGFGIRKFSSGKASYFVKYQLATGQQRKVTLGAVVPGILADMRRKASDVLAHARTGRDISGEKKAALTARKAEASKRTVGDIVPVYLQARQSELRRATYTEWARYLSRYWESLHPLEIKSVTRNDVVAQLDRIVTNHGKVSADRAKTALSNFFAWAIDRGHCDATPVIGIKRRNKKKGERERVLSEAELVAVWRVCGSDSDYGRIIRLLILTGQRREEIAGLMWHEINLEKRQIDLPGDRTKNHRPHIIPLGDAAIAIIQGTHQRAGRKLLFGDGEGPYSGWSRSKDRLNGRLRADMAPWVLHDIRRSVITHLGEHGLALPHVREMLVNHQSGHKGGVAGVYDKAQYLPERRQALDLWGAHFEALVSNNRA